MRLPTGGKLLTHYAYFTESLYFKSPAISNCIPIYLKKGKLLYITRDIQKAGLIDNTKSNTFLGYQAGSSVTTGTSNTCIGHFPSPGSNFI
jgi:hypothetical protein